MTMRPVTFRLRVIGAILTCGLALLVPVGGGCIETAALLQSLTNPPADTGMDDDGVDSTNQSADNADDQVDDNANDNGGDANGDSTNDNSSVNDNADAGPQPDDQNMPDDDTDSEVTEGVPPLPDDAVLETSATGVQTYDFVVGEGESPEPGGDVRVAYTGYLERDGTIFDSNDSVVFNLGGLIAGFSEGVLGMQVGGMRRIIIPPDQGYGAGGNPNAGIGGEDVIIFDVELLEIP